MLTVIIVAGLLSLKSLTNANKTDYQDVKVVLNRCYDFSDSRNLTSEDILITIPGNLTNSDETVDFEIDRREYILPCTDTFLKTVKWEHGKNLTIHKSGIKGERLRNSGKSSTHFTHDGYFHLQSHYYNPNTYCVKSISETEIELRICSANCHDSSKICIPKCCGVDEILIYWNFTCRKITSHEKKWTPKIHQSMYPHKEITSKSDLEKIHIYREKLKCEFFDQWPLSNALRAKIKDVMDQEVPWKLLPNQRPIFLTSSRKWRHIPEGEYCVDGFANWGRGGNGTYLGDVDKYSVLLLCPTSTFTSGASFDIYKAWTYFSILSVSSIFLLLTAIIHLMLLDKQHLHGLTVLCHSVSMYFLYVFCALAHIVSIYPQLKGEKNRSVFCLSVAILSHYFFMTSFTWLSIMNFDLWLTFRSMRPVSKMSKRIRRFRLYSLLGWGLPLILSSAFYAIDEIYRDPKTEVVVPDYAMKNCFVAIWARGYYMYSLVAIALSFNTVLVLWTFHIFYDFRKQNANAFISRRTKSDKYSVRLFMKLFFVMGVAWFVELLSWYYNGEAKPWPVVFLDCVMFFQALAIFFIFCINRRTLKQLEEKYACLRIIISPIRQYTWFKYSDADGLEMTTPGSTPRKLSLSATNNTKIDSTLPRKASASSIRSGSSSKYVVNGKTDRLESVSLDSETESNVTIESKMNTKIQHAPDLISNA